MQFFHISKAPTDVSALQTDDKGVFVVNYISAEIFTFKLTNKKFYSIFTETQRGRFYKY